MDLHVGGQSFLVSGGSSGIGLATARLLLDEGALVTICARSAERLQGAAEELRSDRLHTVEADVTSEAEIERAVHAAVEFGGRLDGVAAVGGRGRHGMLTELLPAEVADELRDKTTALLHLVRSGLPHLSKVGGRIVALTAPTALEPDPAMAAVSAGRAAIDNLVRSLALEVAPIGVRVNAVGVGLIDSPRQHDRFIGEAPSGREYEAWMADEAARRRVPLARPGTTFEVAAAIVWLLSPVTSYTTGAVLDVTGGLRSR